MRQPSGVPKQPAGVWGVQVALSVRVYPLAIGKDSERSGRALQWE